MVCHLTVVAAIIVTMATAVPFFIPLSGSSWCSFFVPRLKIMQHTRFIARTVFVKNNDVEAACRIMNRILGKEGIFDQYRRTRFYEKPYQTRRRVNFERCKAIYNEDMDRKIQFILRKNRTDPFPGCL